MYSQYDSLPDRISRINSHIATYLRNPTPTWLAVQRAKSEGMHLVYYYEPVDQYTHFASNGIPVHDEHYFVSEAAFFSGEDEAVHLEDEGELSHRSEEENEAEKVEGEDGMVGADLNVGREGDEVGDEDSNVLSEYDYEWDLYQPFGMVEQFDRDWKNRAYDGNFALMPAPSTTEEEMSEMGDWREEWEKFFNEEPGSPVNKL